MFMIKSDDQRQATAKRLEAFEVKIQQVKEAHGAERAELFAKANRRHIAELREQIRLYDELKEKGLGPFHPKHPSEVGPYLVKARVVSGLSQTELAKKLSVSQPMVFKYENSEYQGVNLETISRVAKTLGVSLNLETFRQPGSKGYDPKRQEAAILYFVQQINNKFLGKTKLMKLLYYTDYEWIQKEGVSVTGDTYVAMPFGPMPKHAQETLKRLEKKGVLRIESAKVGDYDQERYLALQDPDLSLFTQEERGHMDGIARRFAFWTAKQMSDLSHEDQPWQSTKLGHEITLYRISEK